MTDMPERFQLRSIPVKTPDDGEIEEEAEWIYKHAFITLPISVQEQGDGYSEYLQNKGPNTVEKIREALNFMRKHHLEVPFIAFYRKEYVEPELNISELWKVWQWDEKWTQLRGRKENMIALFEKMQQFQYEQNADPDEPLPDNIRALTEEDIEIARNVETMEELRDVYQQFLLYYGRDIPKMKNAQKAKKAKAMAEEGREGEDAEMSEQQDAPLKQATRKTGYHICQDAGLDEIAKRFGLTPDQFGENLRENYQKNEVDQFPEEPMELAQEKICSQFPNDEDVLKGVRHVVAMQIAHDPIVRQCVRQTFHERAKINCRPTKKGLKMIDEFHPCFPFKYLRLKPVKEFRADQFLKLTMAVEEQLVTFEVVIDEDKKSRIPTYFEEIRQLYYRDEFSSLVQAWNAQRSQALERALTLILYPQMAQEIKTKLLQEAKDGVIKACCRKLYNCLKVAPYQPDHQLEDDEDFDSSEGVPVMAICYPTEWNEASFACLIDGDGEVSDYLRLPGIMKRKLAWLASDREAKLADLEKLKDFIATKKPHVIGVSAQSRNAIDLIEDVRGCVSELEQESQMAPISVELVDNEEAIVFMNSNRAEATFREYPPILRQAIAIARRLQDPLVEFAQLCNPDEDILNLKYHPLQDQVSKDELLSALYLEFVNRVNEVGVDLNRAINHPHTVPLVQFICGLGPRKAQFILKTLKQNNGRLENRSQLVMVCNMGPKVFVNCAGFIKIDTNSIGDSTDAYVEVLDGSRVHPETYDWARKMAVDALEYDDTAEDANPAGALEEILESPERLRDLDLDAFAEELERQGYGNKHITLYDIRAELNHRYKDMRSPYRSATNEEKFNMLTKETPQTFYIGKLVMSRVVGIAHKKPQRDQLDQANPLRNDETGLWQCPFCKKGDFPELSEVWSHFDAGSCPGSPVGVRARLDNGVSAFIATKMISDKHVVDPGERVKEGMTIHARITKIDIDRLQVELTCRSSDLLDKDNNWRPPRDTYYDEDADENDIKKEEDKKKQKARQTYIKRVIAHPSFHNISFAECEKLMAEYDQGDVIIRPSSKGADHLTVTWKVDEGVCQHIDVKEENKQNDFSIGKTLWIQKEEFEDLDEIIARHINPMAAFARDILNYKYFKPETRKREVMDKVLIAEKKRFPSKIPYYLTTSEELPGKFMLSYLPRARPIHEFCTVTPDGIKYRGQVFPSLNGVVKWFKDHFRDPVPGMSATPGSATRTPAGMGPSPSINLRNVDPATLRRAAGLSGYSALLGATPRATPRATPLAGTPSETPQAYQTSKNFPGGFAAGYEYNQTPVMTTPMLTTPSYQTSGRSRGMPAPSHPVSTPQYQQTPKQAQQQWPGTTPTRSAPGSTPQRSHGSTPRHHGSSHRSTPRSSGQTPTHRSSRASPRQTTPSSKPSTSQDWAKMAEQWAKKRERESRHDSGYHGPRGDSTPLIDER